MRPPVVIVGAGPTGVTAATLLAQYGVACLVLDRQADVHAQPRAVHLDDEVHRVLARLGVADAFAAISRPALGLRLVEADGRVLAQFSREATGGAHGFPQASMFDQPDLERVLRANLARYPAATMRGGVEVTGVGQDGRGDVRVDLRDRRTGAPETVTARYVLGCDGANSMVRTAIGATVRDLGFAQRWLVVDIATGADLDAWEGVHQVCDPARAATYMRVGADRYRWEFRLLPGETAADYADIATLQPLLRPWTAHVAAAELRIVRVAEYTFRAQIADRWRDRGVFLLGDAAHLTPPFTGQGLGAGLRDAANLAWKLACVLDGALPAAALDTYQVERAAHCRTMIRLAVLVGRAMTAGGEPGTRARRLVVPRLRLVPGLRSKILDSATPPLRRSALVHRGRRPGGLAGTLAPNAVVRGSVRLDDLAAGRFVVVSARPVPDGWQAEIARRGAVLVAATPGSELHRWLRRGRADVAVIRPDGTVLATADDLDRVGHTLPGGPAQP